MKIDLDSAARTLAIGFAGSEEREAFVRELGARQAFLVPLPERLALGTRLAVTLDLGAGAEHRLEAEVMHLFDSVSSDYGTACRLVEWSDAKQSELEVALTGGAAPAGDGATDRLAAASRANPARQALDLDGGVPEAEADESETLGASPSHRIREMNVSQKVQLAMRAGRPERQILLRDNSAQVLQALVANPRLEATEVLRIARTTHVTAPVLERLARDPRWGKNQEILAAVANNPKTPSPLACRLMRALRTADLRRMGKMSSGLRENVRRAALKEYLARTGRR